MREMIMAAKRMHTSRTSSPHVCVYLEPPVYIEQAKRSLISEALGGETAGQCSVVFVGILSLLLTHYETKSYALRIAQCGDGTNIVVAVRLCWEWERDKITSRWSRRTKRKWNW